MRLTQFIAATAVAGLLTGAPCAVRAADMVTTSAAVSPATVARGGHGVLTITLTMAPGAHVNANKLADKMFIPTTFSAAGGSGVKVGTPKYPAAHSMTTGGIKQSVYQGTARITVPFTIAKTARAGTVNVGGMLTYQACNSAVCYPPKTVAVQSAVIIK